MFERFTERSRQVIHRAMGEAQTLGHGHIGTEHLLLALLVDGEGLAERVLTALGVTEHDVRERVVALAGRGEADDAPRQLPFTPRAKRMFEYALRESLSLGHNYVGTEHLLLALVREVEGVGTRVLADLHVDAEMVRREVIRLLSGPRYPSKSERWAEYVTCQTRGHVAEDESASRKRCKFCATTYWTEKVQREQGAPSQPAETTKEEGAA